MSGVLKIVLECQPNSINDSFHPYLIPLLQTDNRSNNIIYVFHEHSISITKVKYQEFIQERAS